MKKKQILKTSKLNLLYEEFEKESDRAAAILAVSLIDESLFTLLKSYFIPSANSNDELFEGGNAPLGTFSSKITIAHRLGLISSNLARDIHLLRKIRNSFAHDIYGCNFENGSVKNRILELDKSITIASLDNFREAYSTAVNKEVVKGARGDFLILSGFLLKAITDKLEETTTFNEPEKEFCYSELVEITDKEIETAKSIANSNRNAESQDEKTGE